MHKILCLFYLVVMNKPEKNTQIKNYLAYQEPVINKGIRNFIGYMVKNNFKYI